MLMIIVWITILDVHVLFTVFLSPAPPLTIERVYEAVKGVKDWRDFGVWLGLLRSELGAIESQYVSHDLCVEALVGKFLRGESHRYPHPSWRAVIQALDNANEIHLADQIIDYGEPVQGEWLCILYVYWDGYSIEALKYKKPISCFTYIIVGRDGRARQYTVLAGVPRFCRRERAFVHIVHAPLVPGICLHRDPHPLFL